MLRSAKTVGRPNDLLSLVYVEAPVCVSFVNNLFNFLFLFFSLFSLCRR